MTTATNAEGVETLWNTILEHRQHMESSGLLVERRSARLREELREIIERRLEQRARQLCTGERWESLQADVAAHATDPWAAADEMLKGVGA
jgi:LAO/AO transport system kinase